MTLTPVPFHHTDPGTPESTWLADERWDDVPVLDLTAVASRYRRVLVVAAHPDDETLGVGGLMADLADRDVALDVLVVTDGERSHPVLGCSARRSLAAQRRAEVERAVARLGGARPTHLGVPDGEVGQHMDTVVDAVRSRSDPDTLVLAPWLADGHADHDALGTACATAVSHSGADLAHYPIWLWHWGSPDALPWPDVVASEGSRVASWRKRGALQEFRSQTTAWVDPGDPGALCLPVLGTTALERAHRLVETLVDPTDALPTVSSGGRDRRARHGRSSSTGCTTRVTTRGRWQVRSTRSGAGSWCSVCSRTRTTVGRSRSAAPTDGSPRSWSSGATTWSRSTPASAR